MTSGNPVQKAKDASCWLPSWWPLERWRRKYCTPGKGLRIAADIYSKILLSYTEKSHLQIKAKNGAVLWCLSFVPAFEPQWFDRQNFGLHLFPPASLFQLCNSKLFSGVFHLPPVTFGFVRVCFVLAFVLVFACFVWEFKWNSTWMVESLRSWRCSRLSSKQY